jgi:pilus assembly protein CpaB
MSAHHPSAKVKAAKFGALGFLAVALGCAALAAFAVGDMMSSKYTGARVVPVVVATTDIGAGDPLRADMMTVRDWPEDAVPPGSFASAESLLEAHGGATFTVGILPGEPIVASRLAANQQGTGVASLIRPKMRAVALKVNDSIGYTGLVYPGAYVDVIATLRDPMGRGPSSRTAVQNARVLSVGMDADVATRKIDSQRADRLTGTPNQGGTYLTLEVTPHDAEIISIAREEGAIDIALRNANDEDIVETEGAVPVELGAFAGEAAEAEALAVAKAEAKPAGRLTRKRKKRRIQLVASDDNDTSSKPAASGRIQTYHAR